ncbi:MAG: phosphosulfolactate synthase [Nitrososphaerota archaeon]|nr:phosphosulfolactate synthase [Nitrososphaerota archaeon]MDG7023940.1 phosphosulfolactate synthase [Nitrososphaerota archaeon]
MDRNEKAFDFVTVDMPPRKPREAGIIEFRGPYYTSVSYGYLKDLLDDWGEYVDGYKFAGGSMRLLPRERVKQIIRTCHDHQVYVSTGGFVERVIVQGGTAMDQYIRECKSLGFDVVEVSSGLASIPLEDKIAIVEQVQREGMKPKPEVTMMIGAGAGTHIVGYEEAMKMRSFDDFAAEVEAEVKAGAEVVMVESEGLTEDLPPEKWRKDVIQKLVDRFGYKRFMFEASDPPVFKWYLTTFGRDVNLFIDHSQIVEFTAWKVKLWGDESIWDGKKLSYKPQASP